MSVTVLARAEPNRHFTVRRLLLCALPLLVLLLWIVALSSLASAGNTATADQPARLAVAVPAGAKGARVVMLDISIALSRKPASGQIGALVRLAPSGGQPTEVGRVSIIGGDQSYQFDISRVLGRESEAAELEVSLIDRAGGPPPSGAMLSIGRAEIVTR